MSGLAAIPSLRLEPLPVSPVNRRAANSVALRPASEADVPALAALVAEHVRTGNLLPRSATDIQATLATWQIAEAGGVLVGCGSLRWMSYDRVELRSLAVASRWRGQGVGAQMVRRLVDRAWQGGATIVFALTRAVPFFLRLGFQLTDRAQLPEKVMRDCAVCPLRSGCDETAVWIQRDLAR